MRLISVAMFLWALTTAACGRVGYDSVGSASDAASSDAASSDAGPSACAGNCECTDENGCDFECTPVEDTCTLVCQRTASCSIICPPNVTCNLMCGGDVCIDQTGNSGSLGTCQQGTCGLMPL